MSDDAPLKPPREAPAVADAVQFIRGNIERGIFTPEVALPTVARMAAMAKVSYVSMWKAVALLKKLRIVATRPGQPIRVLSQEPGAGGEFQVAPDYLPSAKAKWLSVKRLIQRDIHNGTYQPSRLLPSIKQLQSTYGISYSALRKALAALVDERIIVPRARGYAPAGLPASQRARNRVVFIAPCSPATEQITGFYSEELLRCLEKECLMAELVLQIIGYYPKDDGIHYFDFSTGRACDIVDTEDTFGYLSFIPYRECGWEDALRRLAGIRKPVALMDNVGQLDNAFETMANNPHFQPFSMGVSRKPGRDMGRHLLALGHRKVAYLSPYHKATWSINRCAGLASAFDAAGFSGSVRAETMDFSSSWDMHSESIVASQIERIINEYRALKENIPAYFIPSLDRLLHLDEGVLNMALIDAELRKFCEPMFHAVLSDRSITAWVGANDFVAVHAQEFLRRSKISCPGEITLVGYDDVRLALENKLTSYNFNIPALVHAMLRHLIDRKHPRTDARPKTVEIDGIIIERATSGSAARGSP